MLHKGNVHWSILDFRTGDAELATNKMEMKEIAKHKTLWKMSSTSEPLFFTGVEVNHLKKFTIPKIRRTAGKVYLSLCCSNTREYRFIHDTLNQCRLDVSHDLQLSWQFGNTNLVHNEDLEKNFITKRSEMRESGRCGRELEEHFCFLALPHSDVAEIYQNGISTKSSSLKILGNPVLGIYIYRHVDVALNYAHHCRNTTVESIVIFKVLFGRVKKIQPSMDKNKVSLDPSPNFDCHMSRSIPSLKDTIQLQAYGSVVYFYEYNIFSKPVDKPRQCLPYAVVTVKLIGQKVCNGRFMTSLRIPSTGFPKRAERICSLNNCTVAKRIGKGEDGTVVFEHFRKPINTFVQENFSYKALSAENNTSNSNTSNSYGNVQNGNIPRLETCSGQTKHNLAEIRDTSQAHDSGLSFMPSNTKESVNDDSLLNLTYLKNVLSDLSAAIPFYNNSVSSTVITSKLIKYPRLIRRGKAMEKQNNTTGLYEILPFEKSSGYVNSEIHLPSMPTTSASSPEVIPDNQAILTNCLDAPRFKMSSDDSQSQAHSMDSMDYDCTSSNKMTLTGQCKDQDNFSLPIPLSNVVSEVESQKHSEEKAQRGQQRSNIPLVIKQSSETRNSYGSVNTCTKEYSSHSSQKLQSSNLETVYQTGHQMSAVFPLQKKEHIDEYIQNIGKMRNFTDPENNSQYKKKQTLWKETENYFTNETKVSPLDNYISLHQEYKKGENLNSLGKNSDKTLNTRDFGIPESFTSATKDKDELDHLALELQNNLTPSMENLSQKHAQHSLQCEDNFHTGFAIAQKLVELKLEKTNQNYVSIMSDAFHEAKDIPQAKELLTDTVISSHDNSNCSISREHVCVHRKNENEPVPSENNHRDCRGIPHTEDEGQDDSLFCNTHLNSDICLNINFREQGDKDKENHKEAKEENGALSSENNGEFIYGDEKQDFHTNKNFTSVDERKRKNYSNVGILSSEEFSTTFNSMRGEKYVLTETSLLESEDSGVKQKDTQNTAGGVEHVASTTFPQIAGSSVCLASNAAVQITGTTIPALSTNHEDHQRYHLKETCSSESPDFDLLAKHRASDCEINMDKNKLQDSFHLSINEKSVLQNLELENEIEVGSEQCDDAFLFQQDAHGHANVLYEVSGASYEALKSRIDWEDLLGSNGGEKEVSDNPKRRKNSDQHSCKESNFNSSTQKNKTELLNPILLPDLPVIMTNIFQPGFCPTADSLELKDNSGKCVTEALEPEINKKEGKAPGFEIYSQASGENSGYPYEDKFGNKRQESVLVSKSEYSHSFDLSHNTRVNHMSEKENSELLFTKPSNVTTINEESRCFSLKPKTDCNDTRSKKDVESRISKRKLCTTFEDQNISEKGLRQYQICEKKKRLTRQDSFACFASLSQGQNKTFSRSEKHIRNVLDILNNEASSCKSKRISNSLERSFFHLKKAHRLLHTSLQLIAKVGEKRKGTLPRSHAKICNNFWETRELQGYSPVSERKYSSRHVLSRKVKI